MNKYKATNEEVMGIKKPTEIRFKISISNEFSEIKSILVDNTKLYDDLIKELKSITIKLIQNHYGLENLDDMTNVILMHEIIKNVTIDAIVGRSLKRVL